MELDRSLEAHIDGEKEQFQLIGDGLAEILSYIFRFEGLIQRDQAMSLVQPFKHVEGSELYDTSKFHRLTRRADLLCILGG